MSDLSRDRLKQPVFHQFQQQGFVQLSGVLDEAELAQIPRVTELPATRGGSRCLLPKPWCARLATRLRSHPMLQPLIPATHVAVQCTYFEKSAQRNWLVPLHQDLSIPVAQPAQPSGSAESSNTPHASLKDGGWFTQPPASVLEQLVAVRLHLDDCGADDGPLRVVPGTHRGGVLSPGQALALRDAQGEAVCTLQRGAALVLRPLLLHASSKGSGHSRRRVLHFVYGPRELPPGLHWPMSAV